jgi:hypothetical protein
MTLRHTLLGCPRIPCIGEIFVAPDDLGTFIVTSVSYVYESGFAFPTFARRRRDTNNA